MGKHEYHPQSVAQEINSFESRKWITHQWNSYWGEWELSERLARQASARKSRAAFLGTETEAGNHSYPFRYWSKNAGLSDYVLTQTYCTMANDGTICFISTRNFNRVCGYGDYGI